MLAVGLRLEAVLFPDSDDQSMHFVEYLRRRAARRCAHSRWGVAGASPSQTWPVLSLSNACEGAFEKLAKLVIFRVLLGEPVSNREPSSISIDHKNGMLAGVEQN